MEINNSDILHDVKIVYFVQLINDCFKKCSNFEYNLQISTILLRILFA